MYINFTKVPFPPTVNSLYTGKARRRKSDKAKEFEWDLDTWYLKNISVVRDAQRLIRETLHDNELFLVFKLEYVVPREIIYSKAGKVKKIDVTNRIKSLMDGLSGLLEIDDSRFFLSSVEFLLGPEKYVNIDISHTKIRTFRHGPEKENKS